MRMLLAILLLIGSGAALAEVTVKDAWIAEGPPAAAVLGGFMQLHNDGSEDVALIAVSSPAFSQVEMHQSMHEGGMARMQPQKRIVVPANGSVMLEPGGYHLMLIEPKHALVAGANVPLSLRFDSGQTVELSAPVRKQVAAGMGGMHHHHQ